MEQILIVGVGWSADDLTLKAVRYLKSGNRVVLRTGQCGCAEWLTQEGIPFTTMDDLYERCADFDELVEQTARTVGDMAQSESVVYCVSDLKDKTCLRLVELFGKHVALAPGVSDGAALAAYSGDGVTVVSAADADRFRPDVRLSTLVREIASPIMAGEIKLRLMECYPEELGIYISDASGNIRTIPLCELDQMDETQYDHRLCALIPSVDDMKALSRYDIHHLEEIIGRLRDWNGCPWIREQTHESLRKFLVEEAYEAVDAINRGDMDDLYDELGDVLLQIVFHAAIARQFGEFELSDVTTAICRKMLRRHVHVFGNAQADTPGEVGALWEQVKNEEKGITSDQDALRSMSSGLPALLRAAKVYKKACDKGAVPVGVQEAWSAYAEQRDDKTLGRLLFALAGEAGRQGVDAEVSLADAVERYIEQYAAQAESKMS